MKITDKMRRVMKMFGVKHLPRKDKSHDIGLEVLGLSGIWFITGASGSGKTDLLNRLYNGTDVDERISTDDIEIDTNRSLIDDMDGELFGNLKVLSQAGLSDVYCMLSGVNTLSDGQKLRYRIAKALISDKHVIFIDNFCDGLDRVTASVIAHNIHRVAKKNKKMFVLASCHEDFLPELQPDMVIIKRFNREDEIIRR